MLTDILLGLVLVVIIVYGIINKPFKINVSHRMEQDVYRYIDVKPEGEQEEVKDPASEEKDVIQLANELLNGTIDLEDILSEESK